MPDQPNRSRLRALKVHEVSLVDRPANPSARVLLAKRQDGEDETETLDKIEDAVNKGTGGPAAILETVCSILGINFSKGATPMKCPKCDKDMVEKGGNQTCPVHGVHKAESSAEEILKALPAEARAMIEKAQSDAAAATTAAAAATAAATATAEVAKKLGEQLDAMKKSQSDAATTEIAKGLVGAVATTPEDVAHVLKQLDDKGQTVVKDLLTKFNAVLKSSGFFGERGSRAGAPVSVDTEIEKKADEIQKNEPKLTRPQAIAKALQSDPTLYDRAHSTASAQ